MGAPWRVSREWNLNRSERGGDLEGEECEYRPPVYSVKTALRESFDETHGGSFAFVMRGRNLNRSDRGLPGGEECGLTPRVFRKNCPM